MGICAGASWPDRICVPGYGRTDRKAACEDKPLDRRADPCGDIAVWCVLEYDHDVICQTV